MVGISICFSGCGQSDSSGYRDLTEADVTEATEKKPGPAEDSAKSQSAPESADQETAARFQQESTGKRVSESPTAPLNSTASGGAAEQDSAPPKIALTSRDQPAGKKSNPSISANWEEAAADNPSAEEIAKANLPLGVSSPATLTLEDLKLEPREPKLLIPHKSFRQEGKEQALRVTFDDIDLLKVLNMEPVPENAMEMFPDWLRDLDGQLVRIRGFMFPTLSQTGITYFQHVRDNEICCFGRTPKVYDRISTVLRSGKTTNYIQGRPYDVIGTFRFDPVYEDDEWIQLYFLEDAIVIDR